MKKYIFAYKPGSASAKALSGALGIQRIKHVGSKFKGAAGKLVINWGASELPAEVLKCRVLNNPNDVNVASNKLQFFRKMSAYNFEAADPVRIPDWTIDQLEAEGWLLEGTPVVARQKLTGNSGAGIVMANEGDDIVAAPLYTKYVKKKEEYRIHILNGEVMDRQRKARDRDVADENVDWQVRNHANGFIFQRNDFETPEDVEVQALRAMKAVGLDFGAVDVIYNQREGQAYVLEINTAPGLTGTTLDNYTRAFNELKKKENNPAPLRVGDIIKPKEFTPYYVTDGEGATMEIIAVDMIRDSLNVKLLTRPGRENYIGNTYWVSARYFTRVEEEFVHEEK